MYVRTYIVRLSFASQSSGHRIFHPFPVPGAGRAGQVYSTCRCSTRLILHLGKSGARERQVVCPSDGQEKRVESSRVLVKSSYDRL